MINIIFGTGTMDGQKDKKPTNRIKELLEGFGSLEVNFKFKGSKMLEVLLLEEATKQRRSPEDLCRVIVENFFIEKEEKDSNH